VAATATDAALPADTIVYVHPRAAPTIDGFSSFA